MIRSILADASASHNRHFRSRLEEDDATMKTSIRGTTSERVVSERLTRRQGQPNDVPRPNESSRRGRRRDEANQIKFCFRRRPSTRVSLNSDVAMPCRADPTASITQPRPSNNETFKDLSPRDEIHYCAGPPVQKSEINYS